MHSLLIGLNQKQQQAVLAIEGPVLLIAGAGSGKTKTLVHRIAYLMAEKKVPAHNILAVTFTNKAANEMKSRIRHLLRKAPNKDVYQEPIMGTFHSVCARILRRDIEALGYKKSFVIYDTDDSLSLIRRLMKGFSMDTKKINPRTVLHYVSAAKSELLESESLEARSKSYAESAAYSLYSEYNKELKANHALDFDDLINKTIELFRLQDGGGNRLYLNKYQDQFRYILIDEYQDTNTAQYTLVSLLAEKYKNLCVVGDDWQGIYSFGGADIRNILNFEHDYPNAKIIKLEQNYRSTKNIVEASNYIIRGNAKQTDKKLWTQNKPGTKIMIQEVFDEIAEAEYVVNEILGKKITGARGIQDDNEITYEYEDEPPKLGILDTIMNKNRSMPKFQEKYIQRNIDFSQVSLNKNVVLYRTNAQSRALEEVLLQYGMPYKVIGGIRFYERKEIKDIIAYLRLLVNPNDSISLTRVINAPARGIGEKSWSNFLAWSGNSDSKIRMMKDPAAPVVPRAKAALSAFASMLDGITTKIEDMKPSEIIDYICAKTGYKEFINDRTEEGESRWQNIQELKTVASKFSIATGEDGLNSFLEEIALVSDTDEIDENQGALTLMTVHSAKGLEFPNVYMVGMEEGLFPHSRSIFHPEEMDEERRLCYVGMTRAKESLKILYTSQRKIYGNTQMSMPSRFIEDIPSKYIEHYRLGS